MSIQLGTCSYINRNTSKVLYWKHIEQEKSVVKVGNYSSLAGNITFFVDGNHRIDFASTYPFKELYETNTPKTGWGKGAPKVGHDVWIAENCTIMSGVNIGTGSVICANSVVTKDIPPYTIYGGNPARFIRKRFDDEIIVQLLESKWWDLPSDFVFKTLAPVQDNIQEWLRLVKIYNIENKMDKI